MGSLWVTLVAMIFAVPVSFFTAVYLSEYAHSFTRAIIKPIIDILAGIPSVVYGLWGVLVIVPWVQDTIRPFTKAVSRVHSILSIQKSDRIQHSFRWFGSGSDGDTVYHRHRL